MLFHLCEMNERFIVNLTAEERATLTEFTRRQRAT
jgi:hypothetical protein